MNQHIKFQFAFDSESLCFTRIELGLESSGSSNFGFLNMDYKKGLVIFPLALILKLLWVCIKVC